MDKSKCTIPVDSSTGWSETGECADVLYDREYHSKYLSAPDKLKTKHAYKFKDEDAETAARWPEPMILVQAYCIQDTVEVGAFGYTNTVVKNDFGYIIIFTDFLIIALFGWFIYYLDKS